MRALRPLLRPGRKIAAFSAPSATRQEAELVSPQDVKRYIEEGLSCDHVEVVGDGHHFEAVIVSPAFRGKNRVQQHQLVYRGLGGRMKDEIHALSMKTFTPEDWAQASRR